MRSRPLVSVIVPAYNHEDYVTECLESVAAQSYPALELLVIDDGSGDHTNDRIADFVATHRGRFRRVVHLSRENRGTAATCNELIGLARGRFVYQIASDDRAEPHAIATLVAAMAGHPRTALAVGDSRIIDSDGRPVRWGPGRTVTAPGEPGYATFAQFYRETRGKDFSPDGFGTLARLRLGNYIPNGKLFRRSAVLRVGGWRPGTVEDWDLNVRLARRYRMRFVDEVLFNYRWHDSNTIRNREAMRGLGRRSRQLIKADDRAMPSARLKRWWRRLRRKVGAVRRRVWPGARRSGPGNGRLG